MEKDDVVHNFDDSSKTIKTVVSVKTKAPIIFFIILGILGVGTGFLLAQTKGSSLVNIPSSPLSKTGSAKGQIVGSKDEKTFKDSAEGTLRPGGIDGEGAFHLERPGGESQNVYLTSSVVDLSAFVGKKVKVWGETFAAEKAGWLMDVGRLQAL